MSKHKLALAALTLSALTACGGAGGLGFTDNFSSSDRVATADSIFALSADDSPALYEIEIVSSGVSSGRVSLNGAELLGPSDFKNKDFKQIMSVELLEENQITVSINGKPGDQICVRVYNPNAAEETESVYERCVDREAGVPNSVDEVIDLR